MQICTAGKMAASCFPIIIWFLFQKRTDRDSIFAGNYGEAAAMEFYKKNIPIETISTHNSYWLWGYGILKICHDYNTGEWEDCLENDERKQMMKS